MIVEGPTQSYVIDVKIGIDNRSNFNNYSVELSHQEDYSFEESETPLRKERVSELENYRPSAVQREILKIMQETYGLDLI